jgi:hypothetical protein
MAAVLGAGGGGAPTAVAVVVQLVAAAVEGACRGGSRQTAAAVAAAALRTAWQLLGHAGPSGSEEEEVMLRASCILPVVAAKVHAGASGAPVCISGGLRAARNLAEHALLGAGASTLRQAIRAPQRAQRGGRRVRLREQRRQAREQPAPAKESTSEAQPCRDEHHEERAGNGNHEGDEVQRGDLAKSQSEDAAASDNKNSSDGEEVSEPEKEAPTESAGAAEQKKEGVLLLLAGQLRCINDLGQRRLKLAEIHGLLQRKVSEGPRGLKQEQVQAWMAQLTYEFGGL